MADREPLYVHCGTCEHEWAIGFAPLPVADFVKIARTRCPLCKAQRVMMGLVPRPTPVGQAMAWLQGTDTGVSSKTIWSVMTGHPVESYSIPYDPADFGRCYRLLQVMPEWRTRLHLVADKYPRWRPFVDHWDELTALYEEELKSPTGMAPRTYELMKQLREPKPAGAQRGTP